MLFALVPGDLETAPGQGEVITEVESLDDLLTGSLGPVQGIPVRLAHYEVPPARVAFFDDQNRHDHTSIVTALHYVAIRGLSLPFCNASVTVTLETQGATIRPVKEVVREHVEAVVAAHPDVPQYVLAVGLGWSPSTLCRMLRRWAREGVETVEDRR